MLRFFSTVATFGTGLDIRVTELAIESFFPADTSTAEALGAGAFAEWPTSADPGPTKGAASPPPS